MLATFMCLCDGYLLRRDGRGVYAKVALNIFSAEFTRDAEPALAEAIGQWLCGLPKEVWKEMREKEFKG